MTLTSFHRSQLARLIERRRDVLLAELREDATRARIVADGGEEAVALLADIDNADTTRDLGELHALEAACKRLVQGRYGICIDCADDIPYPRLEASPEALRCAPCQERHEKLFGATPTPKL
jgi:DnaK suppressor protein